MSFVSISQKLKTFIPTYKRSHFE